MSYDYLYLNTTIRSKETNSKLVCGFCFKEIEEENSELNQLLIKSKKEMLQFCSKCRFVP